MGTQERERHRDRVGRAGFGLHPRSRRRSGRPNGSGGDAESG
ncbi:MAG: hypothetical protein AVDCRST_MAG49-204 [uncultured Thermomicrobiales bacterium]|uniref:Uncharacterized protein n=1 Tax=uncultured Thermomicrobiales bacterium TaxID=1645740 RepID=A0A6J4TZ95_9BACT|nr:MAG: hypothetical protein AVDCRST_MAG49-204 [uncultured Thermomicrobiales bacterium]